MGTTDLDRLPPIFFPSEGDVDRNVFYPLAKESTEFDCMVGYFTSGVLSELAHTVSAFLATNGPPLRFVISPQLSREDLSAIELAYKSDESFFEVLFPGFHLDDESLRKYTIAALSYLVVANRIQLKVAIKNDGIFHAKAWFFDTPQGGAVVHGSSNATHGGLGSNFEQLVLSREWASEESKEVYSKLREKFDHLWGEDVPGMQVLPINAATMRDIKSVASQFPSAVRKFEIEYRHAKNKGDRDNGGDSGASSVQRLVVPEYVKFEDGPFAHQGKAVEAWMESDGRGILSIATGGGKTITSLIAASKLQDRESRLMVVVAVPTKAIMHQWECDVSEFGIYPINTAGKGARYVSYGLKSAYRNLRVGASEAEVIIVTYEGLFSGAFSIDDGIIGKIPTLLIADEVHNIGSERSQNHFPSIFDYKIGLSATYERQFDEEGTEFIRSVFGDVVFEYGLQDAIGVCLVPFKYCAEFVHLSAEEEDQFRELTDQIKQAAVFVHGSDDQDAKDRWQRLCIKRRALIESAENKIDRFAELLPGDSYSVSKTLVFCTDKNPGQLERVNDVLNDKRITFHQVTAEESANPKKLNDIVRQFSEDYLQVLTSKRVLDEGFNIPQIETAYLLASNTVRRQWTQRLGRILRTSERTGKKSASIYDFIVIPVLDGAVDENLASLIESEYARIEFFSRNSSNYMDRNGGYEASKKILGMLRGE